MNGEEARGIVIGGAFLAGLAVLIVLAMTHTLDDVIVWVLGAALVERLLSWLVVVLVLAVAIAASRWSVARNRVRVHFRPDPHNPHHALAIRHEALGHAAVARGVGAKGIRARVEPDGSGWCEASRSGLTLAESLAITHGGEMAAGPAGCEPDRARFARDLRQAPRRYRAAVEAEAVELARRHHGNSFGRKVERALSRTGRFR